MLETVDTLGVILLAVISAVLVGTMAACGLALLYDAFKPDKEGPLPPYHHPR